MVIVVPHTGWHDFYQGLLVRGLLGVVNQMHGRCLVRSYSGRKKGEAIADIFRRKENFRLAISPEGIRKKVNEWKSDLIIFLTGRDWISSSLL